MLALLHARGVEAEALPRGATPERVGPSDVVCNVASASPEVVVPWSSAGARAGGYLDAAPTTSSHVLLADDPPRGGAPVVPGVGWFSAVGDAVAVVAAARLPAAERADVTAWVPSRRSLVAGASPRERRQLWRAATEPVPSLVDGRVVTDRIAQARRLAWFPRPVGPHHAVGVPGTHWRTLPRAVPGLVTVRTGLALRSSSAELLQGLGQLARHRTQPDGWPLLVPRRAADRGTAGERWALVAEVATRDTEVVRGWAYGRDRHELTAQVVAAVAARLGRAGPDAFPAGQVGVAELVDATEVLDDLAARTQLRWSVTG